MLEHEVRKIILEETSKKADCHADRIRNETSLKTDLRLDSMAFVELVIAIERRLDAEIGISEAQFSALHMYWRFADAIISDVRSRGIIR